MRARMRKSKLKNELGTLWQQANFKSTLRRLKATMQGLKREAQAEKRNSQAPARLSLEAARARAEQKIDKLRSETSRQSINKLNLKDKQ